MEREIWGGKVSAKMEAPLPPTRLFHTGARTLGIAFGDYPESQPAGGCSRTCWLTCK